MPDGPYWSVPGATLYLGDVRECLRLLVPKSVHCCVTSPPYWGLRDYGTAVWIGGRENCDHESARIKGRADYGFSENCQKQATNPSAGFATYDRQCSSCGARRIDQQIGAEPSPDCGTHGQAQCGACFVCSMVAVFREVHRVLRDDGTLWLNLGDSYTSGGRATFRSSASENKGQDIQNDMACADAGLPAGNLVGIPWRVALALQNDGWVLRNEVIWYSPNKMPESVQNRCAKSHEHIFLLTKGDGYYFDHVAIQEDGAESSKGRVKYGFDSARNRRNSSSVTNGDTLDPNRMAPDKVNKRDVWIVPSAAGSGGHYATFSPRLITPCILAGTSEYGACAECGRPWERVVVRTGAVKVEGESEVERDRSFRSSRNGVDSTLDSGVAQKETAGWMKACGCATSEVVPALVLDPFVGSGTTVATSLELGRHGAGIDLSEEYLRDHALPRIQAALAGEKPTRRPLQAITTAPSAPTSRRLRGVE